MKMIRIAVLTAGIASGLSAQNEPDVLRQRKMEMQTFEFVSGQLISGPAVKGAPYSAEAVNETIQVLADGNRIVQRTSVKQYRDAEGRERREETSAMGAIFISDPVAGTRFTLHPNDLSAEKGSMPSVNVTSISTGGPILSGASVTSIRGPETFTTAIAGPGPGGRGGPPPNQFFFATAGGVATWSGDAKTEELGNMLMEGVQAQGTRTTTTIPAGEIGNDRPLSIVDERWYSPDLQMTVMTKHSDPRSGETNFRLSNINRSSPPPYLFEIPAGYAVKAGPQPFRMEFESNKRRE